MKGTVIFMIMATGMLTALGQDKAVQAGKSVEQYQALMQLRQNGLQLHKGAKIINAPGQPVQTQTRPSAGSVHTTASIRQAAVGGSPVKLSGGRPIAQRDWQAARQSTAQKNAALVAPTVLATNKLPAQQMADLKQSWSKGLQPGAKMNGSNAGSTVKPLGIK